MDLVKLVERHGKFLVKSICHIDRESIGNEVFGLDATVDLSDIDQEYNACWFTCGAIKLLCRNYNPLVKCNKVIHSGVTFCAIHCDDTLECHYFTIIGNKIISTDGITNDIVINEVAVEDIAQLYVGNNLTKEQSIKIFGFPYESDYFTISDIESVTSQYILPSRGEIITYLWYLADISTSRNKELILRFVNTI